MKILQITDLHIVPEGETLKGRDPRRQLDACIADINTCHGDADLCVLTGDLTDRGDAQSYARLRDALAELRTPYRLLVGNHDDRAAMRSAFPDIQVDEDGFLQSVIDTPVGRLLLLDSQEPGETAGSYCERRAAWLEARLAECAGGPAYVFVHHPPLDIGVPRLDRIRLRDEDRFATALSAGDVRHIFFGHVHRPVSGVWRGIPFSTCPGTNHQVPFDATGTGLVRDAHEAPSYAVIHLVEAQTTVHLKAFPEVADGDAAAESVARPLAGPP